MAAPLPDLLSKILKDVYDATNHRLKTDATLTGDVGIGAVELKDGTADTRAKVAATGSVAEGDNALAVQVPVMGATTGAAVITDANGTSSSICGGWSSSSPPK